MPAIEQGDVFDYDFGPQRDGRQEDERPALVIQTNHLNAVEGYPLTIVAPLSTKGRPSPSHVQIVPSAVNGLSEISFAKCEQIYTVPKVNLIHRRGKLSAEDVLRIKEALRAVLTV